MVTPLFRHVCGLAGCGPEGCGREVPGQQLSRRAALRLGAAGLGAVGLREAGLLDVGRARADSGPDDNGGSPPIPHFRQPFAWPPVLAPADTSGQVDTYRITMRPAYQQIVPTGPPTLVWGYEGRTPGPTIVQRRTRSGDPSNRRSVVVQSNRLPVPASVHLHGSPTKPGDDGHPLDLVPPGADKSYEYPGDQNSRTMWYHDHAVDLTATNVYRGLAGFFLQEPTADDTARFGLDALPHTHGVDDFPFLLQDKLFDRANQLVYDDHGQQDAFGDVTVVNGVPWPYLRVQRRRYRFRILLGSVSRAYELAMSDSRLPFTVVGSDSGLFNRPVQASRFRLGMAERYEVVLDFRVVPVGTSARMLNLAARGGLGEVMRFDVVAGGAPDLAGTPDVLNDVAPITARVAAQRFFRFDRSGGQWTINSLTFDGDRVAARPKAYTTEVWTLENRSGGWVHPVHIHLVDFEILGDRVGGARAPLPHEAGLKDTVYLGPNEKVRLKMTFRPARDENGNDTFGRYAMHCHNLVHEDHAMMTQLEVVPGGAIAGGAIAGGAIAGGALPGTPGATAHAAHALLRPPGGHGMHLDWYLTA